MRASKTSPALMHFLAGCLFMLLLSAFCAVCLRRFARESDGWLLALASPGLAGVLLILGGALLLPWMGPRAALATLGALTALGTLWVARKQSWPALQPRPDAAWLTLAAIPGVLLAGFYALFLMSVSFGVDDGFFVHTSNMGMILGGKYPPTSFLGEPWQGHYGKDMLTALLGMVFGVQFLEMEWISTCVIQVLHFLFLVHWLRVEGGRPSFGLLGAYFAFCGSAFASHLGLVDTIANNNAVAYQTMTLASYLLLRWWRNGDWRTAVLGGVVLGADALIYELHFGLLGLALFTITFWRKERYKGFLILVTTAVLLASVEGGAITHMAQKALFGRAQHQQNTRKAWQSQNVELKIPKDNIFYLRRDNLRPSRFFETKLRPDGASFEPSRDLAPLWSAPILTCFWYPSWLAPLTLLVLLWQRNLLAGWFFALGLYSVLTPSLVSFGYFEGETARWLFGASFGFSTAFALTLAQALQSGKPRRYLAYIVLVWAIWFNVAAVPMEVREMAEALRHPGNALRDGSPGIVPDGGLRPQPRLSLAHHYGFDADSWAVTDKLRELGEDAPGFLTVKYLVNYRDETIAQGVEVASGGLLNVMGLQTGLSGRLPAGVAGAPENLWCAPLFSQKLEARAFWADPQAWRLERMGVRWLLVDESRLPPGWTSRLPAVPGLKEVFRSGKQSLWEWKGAPEPTTTTTTNVDDLLAAGAPFPPPQARQPFRLPCRARFAKSGEATLEFRWVATGEGGSHLPTSAAEQRQGELPANPDDLIPARLSPNSSDVLVIGPYFPGEYRLEWRNAGEQEWRKLGDLKVAPVD